jgi:hypothetical protein
MSAFGFTRRPKRIRFDSPLGEHLADRSLAPTSAHVPAPGASEFNLTHGQKIALLKMRRSDWSKAVLAKLAELGNTDVAGADFRSLVPLHLAVCKGSFHVLSEHGRWRADRVAEAFAREIGMHVISYDRGGFDRAAFWRCTCGESAYRTRHVGNYMGLLVKGGRLHLEHVGALPKRDVA